VAPDAQGHGLGSWLMDVLEGTARLLDREATLLTVLRGACAHLTLRTYIF
jgi:GNAT superfamily N-acetyltransferase